ncbi:hypothetical protein BDV98DRAFT_264225 [Pterulicium gracile]|uniref:Uncharacterized protein n=1 Tax=Pterulicium gracile TaxID=1884261 RepID=A0A5C3QGS2_9AGAR|nr:hypothetical protein BDV98DRAFT_264225 [Pterula gracilis]
MVLPPHRPFFSFFLRAFRLSASSSTLDSPALLLLPSSKPNYINPRLFTTILRCAKFSFLLPFPWIFFLDDSPLSFSCTEKIINESLAPLWWGW